MVRILEEGRIHAPSETLLALRSANGKLSVRKTDASFGSWTMKASDVAMGIVIAITVVGLRAAYAELSSGIESTSETNGPLEMRREFKERDYPVITNEDRALFRSLVIEFRDAVIEWRDAAIKWQGAAIEWRDAEKERRIIFDSIVNDLMADDDIDIENLESLFLENQKLVSAALDAAFESRNVVNDKRSELMDIMIHRYMEIIDNVNGMKDDELINMIKVSEKALIDASKAQKQARKAMRKASAIQEKTVNDAIELFQRKAPTF